MSCETIDANETCICAAGCAGTGNVCNPCNPGEYQPEQGELSCYKCDAGKFSSDSGAINCNDCPIGMYSANPGSIKCEPCNPGTFNNVTGQKSCKMCPEGTYNEEQGKTSCTKCSAGKHNPNIGKTSESACITCELGFYSPEGSSQCIPCGAGYYGPTAGLESCYICPLGKYTENDGNVQCFDCEPGTFSNAEGSTNCTKCPLGSYSSSYGNSSCDECPPGTYADNLGLTKCIECSPGTHNSNYGQSKCTDCDPGMFSSNYKALECEKCPLGEYSPSKGQSTCQWCVEGTYSDELGADKCKICPGGKSNSKEHQISVDSCEACSIGSYSGPYNYSCILCPPGTYGDEPELSECIKCSEGTYNPDYGSTSASDCRVCPPGSYNDKKGQGSCIFCNQGTYSYRPNQTESTSCLTCPVGTYTDKEGSTECINCPAGTYNEIEGANTSDSCLNCTFYEPIANSFNCIPCERGTYNNNTASNSLLACEYCPLGTYNPSYSVCRKCPPGTYNDEEGKAICKVCPTGTYNDQEGMTSCFQCPIGTMGILTKQLFNTSCKKCPLGTYNKNSGMSWCNNCGVGTYGDEEGVSECKKCPSGTFNGAVAQTSKDSCKICSVGFYNPDEGKQYCNKCPVGTYASHTGQLECEKCPAGTYNYYMAKTTDAACLECKPGTYNEKLAQTVCTKCPEGYYNTLSRMITKDSCVKCDNYEPVANDDECELCPPGTYSDLLGLSANSSCIYCPAGKCKKGYCELECIKCPAGTYSGESGSKECTKCPEGEFNNLEGQTKCSGCPIGTYGKVKGWTDGQMCNNCPAGTYNNMTGQANCTKCSIGTYNPNSKRTSIDQCIICPKGAYCNIEGLAIYNNCPFGKYNPDSGKTSIDDCLPCPIGTYNDKIRAAECTKCKPGTYNDGIGKAQCKKCPIGNYTELDGQISCDECPIGTYNDVEGRAVCTSCPAGTYNPDKGKASLDDCYKCPIGTYNSYTKQINISACLNCPPKTYSNIPGSSKCKNCPIGTYNDKEGMSICFDCKLGTYNPLVGQDKCLECPKGKFSPNRTINACRPCHNLCKKCFGTNFNECYECWDNIKDLDPLNNSTCNCREGTIYDNSKTSPDLYCQSCYSLCRTCLGNINNCTSCVDIKGVLMIDNTCKCSDDKYFLYEEIPGIYECVACHPLCNGCTGPYSTQCLACNELVQAVLVNKSTCSCQEGTYFDERTIKCETCHKTCKRCFGPTKDECDVCISSVQFVVQGKPNTCVLSCEDAGSFYRQEFLCRSCHENCSSCKGSSANDCLSCSSPNEVMYEYTCFDKCPEGYYASNGVCIKCHKSCLECSNNGINNCLRCHQDKLLFNGQCLTECYPSSYPDYKEMLCRSCPPSCNTCLSLTTCTSCSFGYFLVESQHLCVDSLNCPGGTYPDVLNRRCSECYYTCLTCLGEYVDDCTSCDRAKGYLPLTGIHGSCKPLSCPEGSYLNSTLQTCVSCNSKCRSCSDSTLCLECKSGYLTVALNGTNKVNCKECPKGYTLKGNEKCIEICGDGLNLGNYECDDGNLQNGDGCSSTCQIEKGYECSKRPEMPDVCIDITDSYATLTIIKGNKLVINFLKEMSFTETSEKVKETIKIRLESTDASINHISWNFTKYYRAFESFYMLTIDTKILYSLKGSETIYIEFTKQSLIQDSNGKELKTKYLSGQAKRQVYITETIDSVGSVIATSTVLTFVLAIGLNPFKSSRSFWVFINMIQYISFLPSIDCVIPENLETFIVKFFGVSKVSIPFEYLPNWIPNPLAYLSLFKTPPLNEKFQNLGYTSLNFIYNFSAQLWTMFTILLLYTALCIFSKILPELLANILLKLKKGYEYNSTLRILIESYLSIAFCSLLNLFSANYKTTPQVISLLISLIAIIFTIWFIFFNLQIGETPENIINTNEFKETYGIIIEGLQNTKIITIRAYHAIYLFRRFVYATILITLTEYPTTQLILIIAFNTLPMFLYLIIVRPFNCLISNLINLYNEFILVFTCVTILVLNVFSPNPSQIEICGWIILGFIFISLFFTWMLILPPVLTVVLEVVKKLSSKSKRKHKTCDPKESNLKHRVKQNHKPFENCKIHKKRVVTHVNYLPTLEVSLKNLQKSARIESNNTFRMNSIHNPEIIESELVTFRRDFESSSINIKEEEKKDDVETFQLKNRKEINKIQERITLQSKKMLKNNPFNLNMNK